MSEPACYYYDAERNRCRCYVNENLDELLAENARLRELIEAMCKYIKHPYVVISPMVLLERAQKLGIGVDE